MKKFQKEIKSGLYKSVVKKIFKISGIIDYRVFKKKRKINSVENLKYMNKILKDQKNYKKIKKNLWRKLKKHNKSNINLPK